MIIEPIEKWTGIEIYYADGSILVTNLAAWNSCPTEEVQIVKLINGNYSQLIMNYDTYAVWSEGDNLIIVQCGPTSTYGHSQKVELRPDGNTIVTDFEIESASAELNTKISENSKSGSLIDYDDYLAILEEATE